MTEHPHEQAADQHEREADRLEQRGEEIDEHIDETREDWEAKKRDDHVPARRSSRTSPTRAQHGRASGPGVRERQGVGLGARVVRRAERVRRSTTSHRRGRAA